MRAKGTRVSRTGDAGVALKATVCASILLLDLAFIVLGLAVVTGVVAQG